MTNIVWRPIGHGSGPGGQGELVVLDATRRLYAGLNRAGDGWHVIAPARLDDPRVGDGKRHVGQLVCTCPAGTFHGSCYRVAEAEAFEAGQANHVEEDIAWMRDAAPGEIAEVMGR